MLLRNLMGAARGERPVTPAPATPDPTPVQPAATVDLEALFLARPDPVPDPVSLSVPEPSRSTIQVSSSLPENYVIGFVDRFDQAPQKSRDGGTDGYMHASSLIGLDCERRSVLMQMFKIEHWERVSGGHRIMWAQGRATEKHIRDAVIAMREGQGVLGRWTCRCGESEFLGERPALTQTCPRCRHPMDRYNEALLKNEAIKITGSPDLILMVGGKLLVVEIKSMTPEQFDALAGAMPDHANQALIYRQMLKDLGWPVHDFVAVVYGRKQFAWGGAFKRRDGKGKLVYREFHVEAGSNLSRTMVSETFATAERIARHVATRTPPARTECDNPETTKAKGCCACVNCFSLR